MQEVAPIVETPRRIPEKNPMTDPQDLRPARSPPMPQRDERPVATPCSPSKSACRASPQPCAFDDGMPKICAEDKDHVSIAPSDWAEQWLRLCRIMLLELPRHERLVKGIALNQEKYRRGIGNVDVEAAEEATPRATQTEHPDGAGTLDTAGGGLALENGALQAWHRILSRVLNVTMAKPRHCSSGTPDLPVSGSPDSDNASPSRSQPKHICLGDLMEESLSWVDVDSDDDRTSPKQSDMMQLMAMEEAQAQEQAEEPMPRGYEAIVRQQKAPGIVEGLPKCLSF